MPPRRLVVRSAIWIVGSAAMLVELTKFLLGGF